MLFVEIIVKTINVYIYFHISINKNLKPFDQHRHQTREWIPLRNWNVFTVSREYHMQLFLNLYNIYWL